MNKVILRPENRIINCEENSLLLDVLLESEVPVKSPCGGRGVCGKCAVNASGGLSERTVFEIRLLEDRGKRLACQTYVTGDAEVFHDFLPGEEKQDIRLDRDSDFGMAVDIGTTSIQISLVDLNKKSSILIDSFLNPQRRYGHDVISRIQASGDKTAFQAIAGILTSSIGRAVRIAGKRFSLPDEKFKIICFSGNTTMTYFLFGIDVSPLGIYPYRAQILDFFARPDKPVIAIGKNTSVYALPSVSAFIGGDLVGGLAFLDGLGYNEKIFFIDLGTNGEMFLRKSGDEIYAASCAMGPALEGMNISCGMTAEEGAISHFRVEKGITKQTVIGGVTATGICGTGLIDIVSALLDGNIILTTGAMNRQELDKSGVALKGMSYDAVRGTLGIADNVFITQNDIRNIQLAKAAARASSEMLLESSGCDPDEVRHVAIAGAFGENLDMRNFQKLGFIPEFRNAEYVFFGNTSLKAAEICCHDEQFRKKASELRDRVRVTELTARPDFNDRFINSINF